MNTDLPLDNDALEGPIVPTFIRYMMPSLLGLIAMTSASLVDGMFIGNYEGVTALAAVNPFIRCQHDDIDWRLCAWRQVSG